MYENADIFYRSYSDPKCIYCFIGKEEILCKCKDCDFYFCNGISEESDNNTSHIIFHLTDTKHKSICLNPFIEELKCEKCKENNVFDLFCNNNNIKLILCKKCLDNEEEFFPIVENNKQISEKILPKATSENDLRKLKNLNFDYLKKINMQIIKLKKLLDSTNLKSVILSYESLDKYYSTYKLLINAEKQYLKAIEELNEEYEYKFYFFYEQNEDGIEFVFAEIYPKEEEEWDYFYIFRHKDFSVFSGKDRNNRIEYVAKIDHVYNNKSIILKFPKIIYKPIDGIYYIKEKNSLYSYIRMLCGLDSFYSSPEFYLDPDILKIILGNVDKNFQNKNSVIDTDKIPKDLNIPNHPKLNQSQENAILKCLKNKFTMIKGPPGTGKTYLCSVLIYHLLKLKNTPKHILLCAPSNKACDNLAYYLSQLEIKYLRVLSRKREETGEKVENSLYDIIKESDLGDEFNRLCIKKERDGDLYGEDYKRYKEIISKKEDDYIKK